MIDPYSVILGVEGDPAGRVPVGKRNHAHKEVQE